MDNSGDILQATSDTAWSNGSWPTYGGRTKICSASDSSGNSGSCSFRIEVVGEF